MHDMNDKLKHCLDDNLNDDIFKDIKILLGHDDMLWEFFMGSLNDSLVSNVELITENILIETAQQNA
jgi:hypothetical protein